MEVVPADSAHLGLFCSIYSGFLLFLDIHNISRMLYLDEGSVRIRGRIYKTSINSVSGVDYFIYCDVATVPILLDNPLLAILIFLTCNNFTNKECL